MVDSAARVAATGQDAAAATTRPSGVQSLDRAVAILDCFTIDRQELGLSEIARRAG
ncbi:MAG: helix-turn-helix domain-containing protein, partial [Egibacteraceae bacterium]